MRKPYSQESIMSVPDRLHPSYGLQLTISVVEEKTVEAERRKLPRLLPQGLTFAVLRPHFTKVGKVKDISEGGLAFEYISLETQNRSSSEIDIIVSINQFYLSRIPCKIIYEIDIVEEYISMERRRCGLQFGGLTEEQAAKLDFFLKHHTTGTA